MLKVFHAIVVWKEILAQFLHLSAVIFSSNLLSTKCHYTFFFPAALSDYAEMMMQSKAKQLPPGSLEGFVPCINLPMKTVYLNPFPSAIDVNDPRFSEPILITLRTTQKYFFPSQSCVESES